MREILFRGKHLYSNGDIDEWRYGSLSVTTDGHTFIVDHNADCIIEVKPSTVGQYTGLPDRTNAMRIYEGDILCEPQHGEAVTVEWKCGGFFVKFENGNKVALANIAKYCKVIGNIHENKECNKMTKEKHLAASRKNLEIVFYVRDGQNGNPEIVHKIISELPDEILPPNSQDVYAVAEALTKTEYFSAEDTNDLAIECERAFTITEREVLAHDKRRPFGLD